MASQEAQAFPTKSYFLMASPFLVLSVPTLTVNCDCSSRLVVGAPLEAVAVNQTGRLYDCAPATGMCQPIVLRSE